MISEIDGSVKYGGVVKGQRKILIVADDRTPSRVNTASRAACMSTSRKATASAPATR